MATNGNMASTKYTTLKYSLCFGNQSQIVYDGQDLKQVFGQVKLLDVSDLAYYTGHYINAAGRYYGCVGVFPQKEIGSLSQIKSINDVFGANQFTILGAIMSADIDRMSDGQIKLFTSLSNTAGMLFQTRGNFIQAQKLLQYTLDIRAKRFGKTSREYINSLHNMAVLKKDLGQYEDAEKMFNYLVPTLRKIYTPNSLPYVTVLNNKAMLMAELGRTSEAVKLLEEALQIGSTILPANYFDYERILANRALIEQESGNLQKAEELYKLVMTQMEKKEFEDHPDYNNVLVNYGSLLVQKNDASVLPFLTELSVKIEKRYHEHPLYAKALTNIGDFHMKAAEYDKALIVLRQANDIQLKLLGERHKDYLNTLVKIGVCQWQLNNVAGAAAQLKKAIDGYLFLLDGLFPSMSESEKGKFWASLKPNIDTYVAFVLDKNQTQSYTDVYNLHLQTKGLLLNATNKTKDAILASNDTTVQQLYAQWLDVKTALATYYSSTQEDIAEDKVDLGKLEEQANTLEKKLSSLSSRFSSSYSQKQIVFEDVRAALKQKEAAVEIMRVSYAYGKRKGEVEYIGFVVKAGSATPELVRLPEGNNLEKRYLAFYKNSIKAKSPDNVSYKYYWKPFEGLLKNLETVYVSVDGVYNSINVNTLLKDDQSYIIDQGNIVLIPNSKILASGFVREIELKQNQHVALLIGSPEYGNAEILAPLPGTKVEVENISVLLSKSNVSTKIFTGSEASEQNLKSISDPSLLHIATHGYFLSDVDLTRGMTMGVQVSKAKENPLLRSGLMLAGAATTMSNELAIGGTNNGMLNSYEAMSLDLKDTKLVIMSACETGTGEIVNGEGVYGLSRAFQVAGAQKIIMSLWKVDDTATEQLMTAFYSEWILTKDPQKAFLEAQRNVKKNFPEPYYWGAFVLVN